MSDPQEHLSNNATSMPVLPLELVDLILTESTLTNTHHNFQEEIISIISLLSHRFRAIANRIRFKECTIVLCEAAHLYRVNALEQIIRSPIWSVEENVLHYLRTLHVKFGPFKGINIVENSLVSIFNSVFQSTARRDFSLHLTGEPSRYSLWPLKIEAPKFMTAILEACSHPNVSFLHITRLVSVPPSLCLSPYISDLSLHSVSFERLEDIPLHSSRPSRESETAFRNLQSLTYDNSTNFSCFDFKQNSPTHLQNITIKCLRSNTYRLCTDLYRMAGALTTLTLELKQGLNDCPETLDYGLLPNLSSLTISAHKFCFPVNRDTPTLFTFISPLLPRNCTTLRTITIDMKVTVYCPHGYTDQSHHQAVLLKFHDNIGEGGLVKYLEDVQYPLKRFDQGIPRLNVSLSPKSVHAPGHRIFRALRSHEETQKDLMNLFSRLDDIKGVSLSVESHLGHPEMNNTTQEYLDFMPER